MLRIGRAFRWMRSLTRRNSAEQELADELSFHVTMEAAALEKSGLSASAAETEALRRFGGVDRYAEDCRDERGTRVVESMASDLRYAFRMARRFPGFTAAVVLTLGLAIGANSAMFTVVNATLLQRLPFARPAELVAVYSQNPDRSQPRFGVSHADFLEWKRSTRLFADIAVFRSASVTLAGDTDGEPERLSGLSTSSNFLSLLGVPAAVGRTFNATDENGDRSSTAVITHGFWQRRFGGDSSIVGRSVAFGGRARTVIGILPADFMLDGRPIDVVTILEPSSIPNVENHGQHMLEAVGRMKPGVTVEQAREDLATVAARMAGTYADIKGWSTSVFGYRDELVRNTRTPLLILTAAAALVLLIGCINVAGLLFARGATRVREVSLRRALGATRTRLISQLLTESFVLAIAGGVLGVVISGVATKLLLAVGPRGVIPSLDNNGVNGRMLMFTFGLSLLTTVIVGLWPALRSTASNLSTSLRDGGRNSTGGTAARVRQWLVVSEISLALVLLVCSALVVQSLKRTLQVDPGFKADRVVTMRMTLSPAAYPDSMHAPFYRELIARLSAQPGIEAAAAANTPPLAGGGIVTGIYPRGGQTPATEPHMHAVTAVTPGYFGTMQMQIVRGNDLDWNDAQTKILVSEASARQLWPGEEAIGKRIAFGNGQGDGFEVIGIVNDARARGLRADVIPMVYLAHNGAASVARTMSIVVRGEGDVSVIAGTVRRVLKELDRTLPVYSVQSVRDVLNQSIAQPRLNTTLLTAFAALALLLATIGIYGVVSYSVAQRTQELGVRMALGASRANVLQLILREGARLCAFGVVIGVVGAYLATSLIKSWLFGIERGDPVTMVLVAALITAVALAASWLPARRAARVDPLLAMRGE